MGLGKQHHMFSKDPSCSYMEDGVVGERRDGRRETHTRPGGCRNGPSKDSRQMKGGSRSKRQVDVAGDRLIKGSQPCLCITNSRSRAEI